VSFTTRPGADTPTSVIDVILEVAGKKPVEQKTRVAKGSMVIPNVGPHKGQRHKVSHIHEDGTMTIIPWDIHPSKSQYRMGAAKASPHQVEPIQEAAPEPGSDAEKTLAAYGDQVRAALPAHMHADYDKEKAKKKVVKEEEQIDELSHATLKSYRTKALDKANADHKKEYVRTGYGKSDANYAADRKLDKRLHNVGRAFDKTDGNTNRVKVLAKEEAETLEEGTPSVKPYSHPGSSDQAGWKASNKHGKVKLFRMEAKSAAHKHAGINEDVEQIDELSKKTVGRYVQKAVDSVSKEKDPVKASKRRAGVRKAYNKLREDSQHPAIALIAELSRKTLGSYVKKAVTDRDYHRDKAGTHERAAQAAHKAGDKESATAHSNDFMKSINRTYNRKEGIAKAVDKLTKD